ncbi:MAG: hypothetical protein QOI69_2809 [Pseudonocardiales bacterium]|nr:hypothetical protein [Pseudonocardiales bacterium]
MPGRIEADADVVLWLVVGNGGTGRGGERGGALEIVHPDLEMHHHLLVVRLGGPHRTGVVRLGLERDSDSPIGGRSTTQSGSSAVNSPPRSSW